jgi:hypothetical protein
VTPASDGDRLAATVLLDDDDPTLQMILDEFADNNIQTLLASGRKEMFRRLVRSEHLPAMRSASRT